MRLLNFLFIMLVFVACKDKETTEEMVAFPEDFELFFNSFHSDSLFQLEHIVFPLEGVQKVNDGPGDILMPIYWQKEDWVMHKAFDDHNGTFVRSFANTGPIIIEYIHDKNQLFSMERRFARVSGEWHLIYYGLKK